MSYDPNELVNLIYTPERGKQANLTDIRLADAIRTVFQQPDGLEEYFMIVRDGPAIGTRAELTAAAEELGISG